MSWINARANHSSTALSPPLPLKDSLWTRRDYEAVD